MRRLSAAENVSVEEVKPLQRLDVQTFPKGIGKAGYSSRLVAPAVTEDRCRRLDLLPPCLADIN